VNLEPLVLGTASALRPAGLATVYALMSRGHPGRLLLAYIVAGFAFSAAFGIVVVAVVHEADLTPPSVVSGIFDLVVGAAALGFAAGLASGRRLRRSPDDPTASESWALRRLREPTMPVAALVGVATHLPGLFYLLALNSIIGEHQRLAVDVVQVLIYNTIWFGLSVAAVFFLVIRPSAARDAFGRMNAWVCRYERPILITLFSVVGVYLVIHGIDLLVR
jgi:hypothetical protein